MFILKFPLKALHLPITPEHYSFEDIILQILLFMQELILKIESKLSFIQMIYKILHIFRWDNNSVIQLPPTYVRQARVFGFVARKISTKADNACHVFAELDPEQPATAV